MTSKNLRRFIILMFTAGPFLLGFIHSTGDPVLQRIAAEYAGYTRYDWFIGQNTNPVTHSIDTTGLIRPGSATATGIWSWTVADCVARPAPHFVMDTMQYSHAPKGRSPHGDKVYRLFIRNYDAYMQKLNPQPEGQVLVKEVWDVQQVVDKGNDSQLDWDIHPEYPHKDYWRGQPLIEDGEDGRWYTPLRPVNLFVMYKTTSSEGSDSGWMYGVMDIKYGIDKMEVLQHGPINTCIRCHAETKYDHIFGP